MSEGEKSDGKFIACLVVGILALLLFGFGTAGYFFLTKTPESSRIFKAGADLQTLQASLIRYRITARAYPTTEQGLEALVKKPTTEPVPAQWRPLIQSSLLSDPWANPYGYRLDGADEDPPFEIWSRGPDGKEGTGDDIRLSDL